MATCNGTTWCECEETECPKSKNEPPLGPAHCPHWYENEGCCWCGDPPCAVMTRIMAEEDADDERDTPAPDAGKED